MSFNDVNIKVNKPYPEVVDACDDAETVGILKNLANSRVGEMSAALQYIYQSVVADKTTEEIASILEEIGVVEMLHLDMLMHAITLFGGVPKYEDANKNFYSTACLNYTMKLKDMLENNIMSETVAIENYKTAIRRVKNQSLKQLFMRIIEDEQKHIEVFKTIRDNVCFLSI